MLLLGRVAEIGLADFAGGQVCGHVLEPEVPSVEPVGFRVLLAGQEEFSRPGDLPEARQTHA